MSCFALIGDPIAVTWVINLSIFIKYFKLRFLGSKRGFQNHKPAPRPQKWPVLAEKRLKAPWNFTFCSGRGPDSCYMDNQTTWFSLNNPKIRLLKLKEEVSRTKDGSQNTGAAWIGKKLSPKHLMWDQLMKIGWLISNVTTDRSPAGVERGVWAIFEMFFCQVGCSSWCH